MPDDLEHARAERDNYRRALHAACAAVSEHAVRSLDDRMLITRTAVAIMREVLRGGTLSNTGVLGSAGAAPPERDVAPWPALLRVAEIAQRARAAADLQCEHIRGEPVPCPLTPPCWPCELRAALDALEPR